MKKLWTNNALMSLMAAIVAVVLVVCGIAALAEDTPVEEAEQIESAGDEATPQPEQDSKPETTPEADMPSTPKETDEPMNTDTPDATDEPTAAPTSTPEPTKTPSTPSGSYAIQIDPPKGWYSTKADARVTITDLGGTGWKNIRIMAASGNSWNTLVDGGTSSEYVVQLTDNGVLYVEITDNADNVQARSTAINCFDRAAPTVRASVSGDILCIEASDALSGVSYISVNGHRLNQQADGTLDARIKDYADGKEYIEIYAEDKAGNRSETVKVKNPYYGQSNDGGGSNGSSGNSKPAATKKPSTASSNKSTATPKPTATPEATPTPEPTVTPLPTITPLPTATPLPYPMQPTVGMPFLTGGNMQTLDMLYNKATNKQFITVQTRGGEVYYIIIDYDKPVDDEGEIFETYFLNLVDDRDLLAVLADDEKPTPEPTLAPTPTPTPTPTPQPTATAAPVEGDNSDMLKLVSAGVLGLMLVGGGAVALVMLKKSKSKANVMPNFDDFDDDDEDDEDMNEDDEEETESD